MHWVGGAYSGVSRIVYTVAREFSNLRRAKLSFLLTRSRTAEFRFADQFLSKSLRFVGRKNPAMRWMSHEIEGIRPQFARGRFHARPTGDQ